MAQVETATETTEATTPNYTGIANLKQLVLALDTDGANISIDDDGIAERFDATVEALKSTVQRGLPASVRLENVRTAINEFYTANVFPLTEEKENELNMLISKRKRMENEIKAETAAKAKSANSGETAQEPE